jgi:hypothetical protein
MPVVTMALVAVVLHTAAVVVVAAVAAVAAAAAAAAAGTAVVLHSLQLDRMLVLEVAVAAHEVSHIVPIFMQCPKPYRKWRSLGINLRPMA